MRNHFQSLRCPLEAIALAICCSTLSACADLGGDMLPENYIDSNIAAGAPGSPTPLTVVTSNQKVYENLLVKSDFHEMLKDEQGRSYLHLSYMVPRYSEDIADEMRPLPEMTTWTLFIEKPTNSNLQPGKSLNLLHSSLSCPFSSYGDDYQSYTPNGAGLIVREANYQYIDIYVDHLLYSFNGHLIKSGDYCVFGDIYIDRSWFNE